MFCLRGFGSTGGLCPSLGESWKFSIGGDHVEGEHCSCDDQKVLSCCGPQSPCILSGAGRMTYSVVHCVFPPQDFWVGEAGSVMLVAELEGCLCSSQEIVLFWHMRPWPSSSLGSLGTQMSPYNLPG